MAWPEGGRRACCFDECGQEAREEVLIRLSVGALGDDVPHNSLRLLVCAEHGEWLRECKDDDCDLAGECEWAFTSRRLLELT